MTWGMIGAAAVTVVGGAVAAHNQSGPSVTQGSSLTPGQGDALQRVIDLLMSRGSATTPYTGQLVKGPTAGQNLSLAALEEQAMQAVSSAGDAQGTLTRLQRDTGTDVSDMFQKSVADPAIKNFQERILPTISGRFGGSAAFGSDRREAERKATSDLTANLAGAQSSMVFNAAEAAKDRQLKAATGSTQVSDILSQILGRQFTAQTAMQGQQQLDLDKIYQEFLRQQGGPEQNIQDILRAVGMPATNTIVQPGQPGFLTGAAGGIGNALTMYLLNQYMRNNPTAGGTTGSSSFDPALGAG